MLSVEWAKANIIIFYLYKTFEHFSYPFLFLMPNIFYLCINCGYQMRLMNAFAIFFCYKNAWNILSSFLLPLISMRLMNAFGSFSRIIYMFFCVLVCVCVRKVDGMKRQKYLDQNWYYPSFRTPRLANMLFSEFTTCSCLQSKRKLLLISILWIFFSILSVSVLHSA